MQLLSLPEGKSGFGPGTRRARSHNTPVLSFGGQPVPAHLLCAGARAGARAGYLGAHAPALPLRSRGLARPTDSGTAKRPGNGPGRGSFCRRSSLALKGEQGFAVVRGGVSAVTLERGATEKASRGRPDLCSGT